MKDTKKRYTKLCKIDSNVAESHDNYDRSIVFRRERKFRLFLRNKIAKKTAKKKLNTVEMGESGESRHAGIIITRTTI